MDYRSRPFYLLTFGVILILLLPILTQDGMFLDGVLYSSVAHNLANGYGTFWAPRFSEIGIANSPIFHEHPPLNFGIQALFYKLFGSGFETERIYSLITALVNAWLIHLIWKELEKKDHHLQGMSWWAILTWILLPLTYWIFQNNMQENTMGIFVLSAALFLLRYFDSGRRKSLLLAGVSLFLASFSKGVTGLFPLGMIVFWGLIVARANPFGQKVSEPQVSHRWFYSRASLGRMLGDTLILLSIPLIIYSFLLLYPPAQENLLAWFEGRFLHRVNSAPTVDYHWRILVRILNEMLFAAIITVVLIALFRITKTTWLEGWNIRKRWVLFFLLVALSGSAPLALTMVQKGFYMVPSYPFYALAFALITAPGLQRWILKLSNLGKKVIYGLAVVLLVGSLGAAAVLHGDISRDQDLLPDMHRVGAVVPHGSTISIPPYLWEEWRAQVYLQRYYHISLDPNPIEHDYFLMKAGDKIPEGYQEVDLRMTHFRLFQR